MEEISQVRLILILLWLLLFLSVAFSQDFKITLLMIFSSVLSGTFMYLHTHPGYCD